MGAGEGVYQFVTAASVDASHPADVTIERAAGDEFGEGELLQGAGAAVEVFLGATERLGHAGGRVEPAQPQPWGEGLARSADVNHGFPVEVLQRADGLPVVSELAVVVIFDNHGTAAAVPFHQSGAAGRGHYRPERVLVRGSDQHR